MGREANGECGGLLNAQTAGDRAREERVSEQLEKIAPLHFEVFELKGRRPGLAIVDEVNGFCTVGAGNLAPRVPDQRISHMVGATNALAQVFAENNWPILVLKDTQKKGVPEPPYPTHCEEGSGEENLVPELLWLEECAGATHLRKDCINGFVGGILRPDKPNVVVDFINRNRVEVLIVTGICTDICDLDFVVTMLSARNHFLEDGSKLMPTLQDVVVWEPACATYDLPRETALAAGLPEYAAHPRELTHYMGLYFMASRGAILARTMIP